MASRKFTVLKSLRRINLSIQRSRIKYDFITRIIAQKRLDFHRVIYSLKLVFGFARINQKIA